MERLPDTSKEPIVSFDLNEIFNQNTFEIDELDAEDIPDNILSEIILDPFLQNAIEVKENSCTSQADRSNIVIQPKHSSNENRFKSVNPMSGLTQLTLVIRYIFLQHFNTTKYNLNSDN